MYVTFKIKEKEFGFDTDVFKKIIIGFIIIYFIVNISLVGAFFTDTTRFIFGGARSYEEKLNKFKDGVKNNQSVIVIENVSSGTERNRLAHEVLEGTPELFYISAMSYVYYDKTTEFHVSYRYSGEELEFVKTDFDRRIEEICSNVDSKLSDYEKALFVHDYLADNYEYDYSNSDVIHDAYRMLITGRGVCSAYANLFKAICNRLGLGCEVVWTKLDNHDWNVVRINGFWYNVDVTWDDTGAGKQEYFLVPDTLIWGGGHHQWINCGKYKISCFRFWYSLKNGAVK